MKYFIVLAISVLTINTTNAQALLKGDVDIHAGVGFGVYGITSNDFDDSKSTGVPGLISLGAAYQLSDAWSVGLNYERNGFATDPDSNHKAILNNIGIVGAYNFVNSDKNVLNVAVELGFSSFRYDDFKNEEYVIGTGPQFQFGAGWKHYFGGKVGMYMNFSVPFYKYSKFKNADGDELKVYQRDVFGQVIEEKTYTISMSGANFRIGLLLKL